MGSMGWEPEPRLGIIGFVVWILIIGVEPSCLKVGNLILGHFGVFMFIS